MKARAVRWWWWEKKAEMKKTKTKNVFFFFFFFSLLSVSLSPPPVLPFLLPSVAPADLAVVDPVLARVKVAVVVAAAAVSVRRRALLGRGSRLGCRALGLRVRRGALVAVQGLVRRRGALLLLLGRGELGLVGFFLGALCLFGLGELVWREFEEEEGREMFGVEKKKIFFVFVFNADVAFFLLSLFHHRSKNALWLSWFWTFIPHYNLDTTERAVRNARGDQNRDERTRNSGAREQRKGKIMMRRVLFFGKPSISSLILFSFPLSLSSCVSLLLTFVLRVRALVLHAEHALDDLRHGLMKLSGFAGWFFCFGEFERREKK
jgi:hypothetical protein